jgi:hypothetical protein
MTVASGSIVEHLDVVEDVGFRVAHGDGPNEDSFGLFEAWLAYEADAG